MEREREGLEIFVQEGNESSSTLAKSRASPRAACKSAAAGAPLGVLRLRRAETDLETARRRLRFAQHGGRSSLAELPMGEDAGAFGSVYDARGDALARAIRDASRDPARYEIAVAGLERRKTLVVDRRLADGRGGGADGG